MVDFNQRAAVVIGCEDTAIILENKIWESPLTKLYYVQRAVPRKDVAEWIASVCL